MDVIKNVFLQQMTIKMKTVYTVTLIIYDAYVGILKIHTALTCNKMVYLNFSEGILKGQLHERDMHGYFNRQQMSAYTDTFNEQC